MVECPWCGNEFEVVENLCPYCKHEVLPEHVQFGIHPDEDGDEVIGEVKPDRTENQMLTGDPEQIIASQFKCIKCGHEACEINEAAMNGTGLSKLLDIEYLHFIFASCLGCGIVEIYNPDIVRTIAQKHNARLGKAGGYDADMD